MSRDLRLPRRMRRRRLALFVALALAPLLLWGVLPLASSGSKLGRIATRIHYKQQRVNRLKSREGVLTTDISQATAQILSRASGALGREITGVPRGGASDASHFAPVIPLTIDGLGPRGGGAHTPGEFVLTTSLRERAEVALALVSEVLAP